MNINQTNFKNMEGTIKTLTVKGFGFITVEGEAKELFFHSNELRGVSYDELKVGDKLSFDKSDSPKGPNAVNVSRI
jgi:CspA family cold shock protein